MVVPMTTELTCDAVAGLIHAYLDEALPPERRQGADAHLAVCPECRRLAGELRCMRRMLRSLPQEQMPASMKHRLLDTLQSLRPTPP